MSNYQTPFGNQGTDPNAAPTGTIADQLAAASGYAATGAAAVGSEKDPMLASNWATNQAAYKAQQQSASLQAQAKNDPWSFYRASAADNLSQQASQPDPSKVYQDKLQQMMTGSFSPDDPSYQFRFDQGQQALERSQASKGFLGSGNAAIELQQYGQGAASQEYQAQFSRLLAGMQGVESTYNTQQSRLMELAGVQTPGVQSGINAGITQSQISASASMSNNAANNATSNYQFNQELALNSQQQAGVAAGLGIDTGGGVPSSNTTFSPNWGSN